MLEPQIKKALEELLDNPFQKTKKLLPNFEDRWKLYTLPAFEIIVKARKEGRKVARRVKTRMEKDTSLKSLAREKKWIEAMIEKIPPENRIPVKTEQIINADKKQGAKSYSYYDAEAQALGKDEKYVCLMHNLQLIKDAIFNRCKVAIFQILETVPNDYRWFTAPFLRKQYSFAPGKKSVIIPKHEEEKRYREINLFADISDDPEIEELMQPDGQSLADAKGWSKLGRAEYINPATGRLGCSFA